MHITGFKTALTRTINNYAKKNNLVKDGEDNFTGDDVLEGLTAVISHPSENGGLVITILYFPSWIIVLPNLSISIKPSN